MPMQPSKYIWQDGRMVRWEDATVHVLTHALHYGSSVFEGIRVYRGPNGPVGLRLTDHISRMYDSAKIYYLEIPYELDDLVAACKDVVIRNGLHNGAYVRPLAFRGYGEMGVAGDPDAPAQCIIAAWEWGSYLGEDGLDSGVDVCISSWQRAGPNTIPTMPRRAATTCRASWSPWKRAAWDLPRASHSAARASSARVRARISFS